MKRLCLLLTLLWSASCASDPDAPAELGDDQGLLASDGSEDGAEAADTPAEDALPPDPSPDAGGPEVEVVDSPDVTRSPTYACGWPKNDPGTLIATGTGVGDVVADWGAQDQCGERYRVWDGYGRYMLLLSPVFW